MAVRLLLSISVKVDGQGHILTHEKNFLDCACYEEKQSRPWLGIATNKEIDLKWGHEILRMLEFFLDAKVCDFRRFRI